MVTVIVDGAAVVVDGAVVVVATVRTDRAVDKSEVFAPSCEVGLNLLNFSLKFNREGIVYYALRQKRRYLELFSQCWGAWTAGHNCHPDNCFESGRIITYP